MEFNSPSAITGFQVNVALPNISKRTYEILVDYMNIKIQQMLFAIVISRIN